MIATRKAQMARAANMMYSSETRLKQQVIDAWRTAHEADRDSKNRKLMLFFVGRDEWWKTHVVETWRRVTRHERAVRRFLVRWMFQGMAKTFTAWQRHVRRTVDERNRGLAKGVAMLSGGVRYKCFVAWAEEARTQREERDAVLRQKLLRNGALMSVKVVRAWFDFSARRRAAKRRVCFGASHAGAAFRTWLLLIDAKRRREFLEWALGPDMAVLGGKLRQATKQLAEQTSEQFDAIRDSFASFKEQWKDEVAVQRKETQEKLDKKVDVQEVAEHARALDEARDELEAVREQISAQAETQRALSVDSARAATELGQQVQALSADVEARVSQAHRAIDRRAGEEERALHVVTEELALIKNTKANHEELLQLVKKLQHRPRPGQTFAVQQLLPVPTQCRPARRAASGVARAPGSAKRQQASAFGTTLPPSADGAAGLGGGRRLIEDAPSHAEMREVATKERTETGVPYPPFVATSAQILLRPMPMDAEVAPHPDAPENVEHALGITRAGSSGATLRGQALAPPSSHTSTLSARASPTVNAIVQNRRPTSARATSGRSGQVQMFSSRTERLERSLESAAAARADAQAGRQGGDPAQGRRPGLV